MFYIPNICVSTYVVCLVHEYAVLFKSLFIYNVATHIICEILLQVLLYFDGCKVYTGQNGENLY